MRWGHAYGHFQFKCVRVTPAVRGHRHTFYNEREPAGKEDAMTRGVDAQE